MTDLELIVDFMKRNMMTKISPDGKETQVPIWEGFQEMHPAIAAKLNKDD